MVIHRFPYVVRITILRIHLLTFFTEQECTRLKFKGDNMPFPQKSDQYLANIDENILSLEEACAASCDL